ncbi:hypothetical protein AB7008_48155 [Bradyrhizobium sp. 521_C7_N1_3]|uniref:hypothetical protein n=1 Tax=Bradyrhizobium sp. 521_C7_N1_3 TaxID=3240368 RepID=UPI003F8C3818
MQLLRTLVRLIAALIIGSLIPNARAEMAPYELANIDWNAAVKTFVDTNGDILTAVRKLRGYDSEARKVGPAIVGAVMSTELQTINVIASTLRPNVFLAGAPVLLPIDFKRLAGEIIASGQIKNKDGPDSYFAPLGSLAFYPGPYGYRAYFRLKNTSTVVISGSSVFYDLSDVAGGRLPILDSCGTIATNAHKTASNDEAANRQFYTYLREYSRRLGLIDDRRFGTREAAISCLFAGALIEVDILCDAAGDPDCQVRDLARLVFSRLTFIGGSPRSKTNPAVNDPLHKLANSVNSLEYDAANAGRIRLPSYSRPGDLLPGSGVQGGGGSEDFHLYGQLLFPTDLRAAAQTVIYRKDQRCYPGDKDQGHTCLHNGIEIKKAEVGNWRDNFCEDREANRLYTCPDGDGHGHAGQDVWGKNWNKRTAHFPLRAVVDGVAFRRFPDQPAVTISDINGSNIDYIYRHMRPSELTRHGIPSSVPKDVKQGCVLAYADGLESKNNKKTGLRDGNTFYDQTARHLHFEIRIPTRSGFQNVSPYWTLVQAHRFQLTKVLRVEQKDPCGKPFAQR